MVGRWLAKRSTADLLVLLVAGTVCGVVLLTALAFAILTVADPTRDVSTGSEALTNILGTLVGMLAGFLAGRHAPARKQRADDQDVDPDS